VLAARAKGHDLVSLKIAPPSAQGKKKARNMNKLGNESGHRLAWRTTIALDGGTTNTRARLVRDGRIVATARREIGVRDAVLHDPSAGQSLSDAVRDVIAEVSGATAGRGSEGAQPAVAQLIVAAGMLTSEVGLLAVPHVLAPAGALELAKAVVVRTIPTIVSQPIHFVPGLRTPPNDGPDGWMRADVMRGEECETLGARAQLVQRGLLSRDGRRLAFVWPGSHTKLVEVDGEGRITRSHTTLAGEFLLAIFRHSLIHASLPAKLPDFVDLDWADSGARAVLEAGLARAAFLVRVADLEGRMGPQQRASFWVGAVVADDVRHLALHPILATANPVWVGGREPLRSLYARWLGRSHHALVTPLEDELAEAASAIGAIEVAGCHVEGTRWQEGSTLAEPAP
jgi:2-dehydro-3-deoxygalactonokinase